ncbi:MAG TPA: hypothetical protein VF549_09595 [Solirubrobacteraceae bacterium]
MALGVAAPARAVDTARLAGGTTTTPDGRHLPVTGGYVDPKTGEGRVEHRGLVVVLRRAEVRRVRTSGLTTRIVARSRRLGGTVRLRLRLGQLVLEGGTATLRLDPTTFAGAEASGGTFRITGGRLDARTLRGEVGSAGVLRVTRGGRSVEVRDLGLDMGDVATAQIGDVRPPIATLAALPDATIGGLTATLTPFTAALTAPAADGLNFALQTDAFREGQPLGTLAVRARLRG